MKELTIKRFLKFSLLYIIGVLISYIASVMNALFWGLIINGIYTGVFRITFIILVIVTAWAAVCLSDV